MKILSMLLLVVLVGVCPSFTSAASNATGSQNSQYDTFVGNVLSIEDPNSDSYRPYLKVVLSRMTGDTANASKVPCVVAANSPLLSTLRRAKDNNSLCRFSIDKNVLAVIGAFRGIRKVEILTPIVIYTSNN